MDSLERGRAKQAAIRAAGGKVERKSWSEKYAAKPGNLRLAIACMCAQCMGGEDVPGVREDIRGCTAKGCPLYPHRPYRFKGEGKGG